MTSRSAESLDVRLVRSFFKLWPLERGRGRMLRIFGRRRRYRPDKAVTFVIDRHVVIEGDLADHQVRWAFVRDHERDTAFQLSLRLLRPGGIVIDVGANLGLWTLPAASRLGSGGMVHAFEPVPYTMRQLRRNIDRNELSDSIRCVDAASSDHDGRIVLHKPPISGGHYNSGAAGILKRPGAGEPLEVDAVRLDTYCSRNGLRSVDFLKVDVEGAELLVFRGAENVLSDDSAPAIMFELDSSMTEALGWPAAEVKRHLRDHGYQLLRPAGATLVPVPVEAEHGHDDLLALKDHHLNRLPNSIRP